MKTLGKLLREAVKKQGAHSVCSFAYNSFLGKQLSLAHVCMAGFQGNSSYPLTEACFNIEGYVNRLGWSDPTVNLYKEYYEWVANESIFSSCILTKKFEDAMEEAVYVNIEETANKVKAACMFVRFFLEFPLCFTEVYCLLRESGESVFDSMFVSMTFNRDKYCNNNNHNPIGCYRTIQEIQIIYKNFSFNDDAPAFKRFNGYVTIRGGFGFKDEYYERKNWTDIDSAISRYGHPYGLIKIVKGEINV